MSRIRSIKPEFCVSEQIADCSPTARLLFILMWMFCDDQGVHPASARALKMEVFPADNCTPEEVQTFVDELLHVRLLAEFEAAGKRYWCVTGWKKHQRIEKPNAKYPAPPIDGAVVEQSSSPPPPIADRSTSPHPRKGGESTGVENPLPTPDGMGVAGDHAADPPAPAQNIANCPHEAIINLYHRTLPVLPRVTRWTKQRKALLRARWREEAQPDKIARLNGCSDGYTTAEEGLGYWEQFFEHVAKSSWLTGQKAGRDGKPFLADLEWLIRPKNFVKVIEGKYDQ